MDILYGGALLVYGGLLLKGAGFMVRDELVLRGLVAAGTAMTAVYYATRDPMILPSFLADTVLVSINLVLIGVIVLERTTFSMTQRQKRLFGQMQTLTPGQFRRLMRLAEWRQTEAAETVMREGAVLDRLFWVEAVRYEVEKDGRAQQADGPGFLGEISLLRDMPASATVRVPAGSLVVSWPSAALRREMGRSRAMQNALIVLFSQDLAAKMARSLPAPVGPVGR